MAAKLTDKAIKALKHGPVRQEIGDGGATGLRLVLQPTPSKAKGWVFRYRSPVDNRQRKYTIGTLDNFSLAEAREAAGALRKEVSRGTDPVERRRAERATAADTSREVGKLLDKFIEAHVDTKRPTTAKLLRQQIEADIRPAWGRRRIETITRGDISALVAKIADRGATVSANRVFSTVRKFLNWCVEPPRAVIPDSPARGMRRPNDEAPRERVLTDIELRALWKATADGSTFRRA